MEERAQLDYLLGEMLEALKVSKAYIEETAYEYDEDGRPNDVYRQIIMAIEKADGNHETTKLLSKVD